MSLIAGPRGLFAAAVLFAAATFSYAGSRTTAVHAAKATPWEQAERGRDELEALPQETRTRADYTAAMDRFREIYHDNPRDVHSAASVYAVAELLAEQGRGLHDAKSLKASVGQYEFLRKQYPGSSLRVAALLAEAQIEENDLRDETAARERYYMAVELDEDYVEARANLGCVLSETGHRELAVAAFQGALVFHPDYADVHYHLARTLDELDRRDEAAGHWQSFLDLAPDSPWADEARTRLA